MFIAITILLLLIGLGKPISENLASMHLSAPCHMTVFIMKTFTELVFILTMLSNGRCQEICRSSDHGCPIEFSVYRYPDMNNIRARRRSDDRMGRPAMRPYSFLGQMNWSMTDTGTWREGPTMIAGANIPLTCG